MKEAENFMLCFDVRLYLQCLMCGVEKMKVKRRKREKAKIRERESGESKEEEEKRKGEVS